MFERYIVVPYSGGWIITRGQPYYGIDTSLPSNLPSNFLTNHDVYDNSEEPSDPYIFSSLETASGYAEGLETDEPASAASVW